MDDSGDKIRDIVTEIMESVGSFSEDEKNRKQTSIEERLFDFANYNEANVALLYLAGENEVNTLQIIDRSIKRGKTVTIPVFDDSNNKTTLYKLDNIDTCLMTDEEGRLTPDPAKCKTIPVNKVDIAIIPGMAFDEKGGRIGPLEVFYNKFIPKLPATVRKVAIAFEEQVIPQVPGDSRNKHIDIIVTDTRTIYKI
jgi:5-formyltetrahydrofolate cyclo-ligase